MRASEGGIPTRLLSAGAYRELFSRLGIDPGRPVVIYSAGESRNIDATFLAWLLAGAGQPQVFVLDGGFFKWQLEQRPVVQRYPRIPVTRVSRPAVPAGGRCRSRRCRRRFARGALLVDARPPDQYDGTAGAQMRHGHIPGAISHYWQDDLTQEGFGHVWKPVAELRRAYEAQGITPDKDIIAYCNSATEASHVHFTLRYLLGYPRVRIYVGLVDRVGRGRAAAGGDRSAALAHRIAIPLRSCPGRQIRPPRITSSTESRWSMSSSGFLLSRTRSA